MLRYLSDDHSWLEFERELGSQLVQVYDLKSLTARLDSTTASTYCGANPDGLFQYGHSKDHRPDLTQVKLMLSTLDIRSQTYSVSPTYTVRINTRDILSFLYRHLKLQHLNFTLALCYC